VAFFAKAQESGKELYRSIREKKHFPEQDAFLNAFKARMKGLVEFQQKDWVFEYEYWQARG
jgi:hypothetical protein